MKGDEQKENMGMNKMSNSMSFWKDFVKKHPDTGHSNIPDNAVYERKSEPFFRGFEKELDFNGFDVEYDCYSGKHKKQHVVIKFDPEAEYDTVCAEISVHDGTLYFTYELIEKVIKHFSSANVYTWQKGSPESGSNITYTVGDFIIINESGSYGTAEKPWLREKTTVVLPFKYDVEKGK